MRILVIGGGITGLAAAYRIVERAPGAEVVLVEQADRPGGKLRTGEIAGGPVEVGAEVFLARDPGGGPSAAVELARSLGLGDQLVHPAIMTAAVVVDGRLRPIPGGTLMGVPADPAALGGVAAPAVELDQDGGKPLLGEGEDVAVGALVRRRLGDAVADRLVDPLLGGVYAGRADDLSLAATIPALADAARREHTLTGAVRAALAARPPADGPVFAAPAGGVGRLVDALAERLAGAGVRLRYGLPARALACSGTAWQVMVGSTRDHAPVTADAVLLAVPARPAARLLSDVDSVVAGAVGVLDYASVALVTLLLPEIELPELSGLLVPATEGYAVKAATFIDRKWTHARRDGLTLVRVSVGRYGDEAVLQRTDDDLIALVRGELGSVLGTALPAPVEARVQRWGGALPQYTPGHLDRVGAVRAALPTTLALAGAAFDGVGIPACIRSGQAGADRILAGLGECPS